MPTLSSSLRPQKLYVICNSKLQPTNEGPSDMSNMSEAPPTVRSRQEQASAPQTVRGASLDRKHHRHVASVGGMTEQQWRWPQRPRPTTTSTINKNYLLLLRRASSCTSIYTSEVLVGVQGVVGDVTVDPRQKEHVMPLQGRLPPPPHN